MIKTIKSQLDALEISNNDFRQKHADGGRESDYEFRRVAWNGFANRLRSSLLNFNRAQSRFEKVYDHRTGVNGFNPDLTTIPVQESEPTPSAPATSVQRAFAAAVDEEYQTIKKEDMKRLERSMREIREAFIQIAALVDSQGEMLDCIEFSVVNAKNYAHQANKQLIQARKKQRQRSILWVCCCLFLTVALVFGILGILQATGAANIFKGCGNSSSGNDSNKASSQSSPPGTLLSIAIAAFIFSLS